MPNGDLQRQNRAVSAALRARVQKKSAGRYTVLGDD